MFLDTIDSIPVQNRMEVAELFWNEKNNVYRNLCG
jgi:hypothetical protein